MKIKLIICQDREQCRYYFQKTLATQHTIEKKYRYSFEYLELANDNERVVFVTPDNPDKIRGMRIKGHEERGTPFEHKDYNKFMDIVKASMR